MKIEIEKLHRLEPGDYLLKVLRGSIDELHLEEQLQHIFKFRKIAIHVLWVDDMKSVEFIDIRRKP